MHGREAFHPIGEAGAARRLRRAGSRFRRRSVRRRLAHPMAAGCPGGPGGDEGGDDAAAALVGMRQDVAHEVYPAALPGRCDDLRDGGLAALRARRRSPAQRRASRAGRAGAGNRSRRFRPPRRRSLCRALSKAGRPSIRALKEARSGDREGRRPAVSTPTAMITPTATIRPFWRTFTSVAPIRRGPPCSLLHGVARDRASRHRGPGGPRSDPWKGQSQQALEGL